MEQFILLITVIMNWYITVSGVIVFTITVIIHTIFRHGILLASHAPETKWLAMSCSWITWLRSCNWHENTYITVLKYWTGPRPESINRNINRWFIDTEPPFLVHFSVIFREWYVATCDAVQYWKSDSCAVAQVVVTAFHLRGLGILPAVFSLVSSTSVPYSFIYPFTMCVMYIGFK